MNTPQRPTGRFAKVEGAANWVFDAVARLCGWILVVMAITITLDIIIREMRTVGWLSFNWQFVAEWSAFLVIFMVFAGLAHTLRAGGHITVNLLFDRLPFRLQRALALMNALIAGSVLVYMAYRGVLWMMLSYKRGITSTSVIKTPLWIPNSFVVFGLVLFAVAVLFFIVRQVRELATGEETASDSDDTPPSVPGSGAH